MAKKRRWPPRRKSSTPQVNLSLPFHEQIAQLQRQIDRRAQRERGEAAASPPPAPPKKKKEPKQKNQSPPKKRETPRITEIRISPEDLKLATHAWLYLPIDPRDDAKNRTRWKLCVCMLLHRTPNVAQLAKELQVTEQEIIEAPNVLKKLKEANREQGESS